MPSERVQRQIDTLLSQAEEAMHRGDWETVRLRCDAVLRLDAENEDAKAYLKAAGKGPGPEAQLRGRDEKRNASTPATPTHPASFANGRYTVKRFLGEGGKKRVYLAHDTVLDRDVAFALIKTEGLDETAKTRITREAQAMGRLGDHPHLMPIFDLGNEHGQPFMVLPLMGGGDVEGVIKKAPNGQVPLDRTLEMAKAVAKGLAFAHGKSIVHRDIKPGNVWLTQDGTPKIGDFGLAVAADNATRLTTEGMMVGTVSYMPPEQALGGEITPKADLYSLGAMLYEMVTGRPPFLGDDAVSIISQHINVQPVAPTWHNAKCPKPLEALILRLLAKDPKERPASAADVLKAIEAIDPKATVETTSPDQAKALEGMSGGVFVGRQKEMGELKAALEDALSGKGRLLTLVGEPGIGKTRTAQELATYAGLRQAQVLWGRCYEAQGVPPYWPWVQALRSYVREHDAAKLRTEMGSGAAEIAEIVSDVRERLPDLKPSPAVQDPEAARFRLFDSVTSFLKTASRTQPLVLVLDDLHWADKPSLLLLEFVARELTGARLLIIGTYRDMELNRQHPLSLTLGELARERLYQRVLLRGLTQEDVGRFVELAAGITPPADLVKAVYTQTEGNPFFVTEVVRLLVQEGEIGRGEKKGEAHPDSGTHAGSPLRSERRGGDTTRESWTVRIPEGVREVIGRRLDRLSARCNEVLTTAAVIGREFGLDQLVRLMGDASLPAEQRLSEDMLLTVMEEALGAKVIDELPKQVGRYQFTHALIQETLAGELSTTRRVRLHARIAQALEALYGANVEAHAAELAEHYAEAQTLLGTEKYRKYATLAGQKAEAAFAWEEAHRFYQAALATREGQQVDEGTADLWLALGRTHAALAHLFEAWNHRKRAFDFYSSKGLKRKAIEAAKGTDGSAQGFEGVVEVRRKALGMTEPRSIERAEILNAFAVAVGLASGDYAAAENAISEGLVIARAKSDRRLEVLLLSAGAVVAFQQRKGLEAVSYGRRALELNGGSGSAVEAAMTIGEPSLAKNVLAKFLPNAEATRDHRQMGLALRWRADLNAICGQWSEALADGEHSLRLLRGASGQESIGVARLALVESEIGDVEGAQRYLDLLAGLAASPVMNNDLRRLWFCAVVPLVARITGDMQRLDEAIVSGNNGLATTALPRMRLAAHAGHGLAAVLRKQQSEAAIGYTTMLPERGTLIPSALASADRLLGLLAQTVGEPDRAAQHFEDAIAFCRKAGYRPELSWSLCDYADLLQQRDAPGDRQNAAKLLEESLRIGSELGMKPLMERVLARRKILKA